MFKGARFLKTLFVSAFSFMYLYVIYKLYVLNWFDNAGVPTLVVVGTLLIAAPVVGFNIVKSIK